jgi:hypothetical protein
MATMYRYQLPVEQTGWALSGETQTSFTWEYEDERSKLLALYDKGKKQQWDAAERIDWSLDLDPENPQELDDRMIPIYGSPMWDRLTHAERVSCATTSRPSRSRNSCTASRARSWPPRASCRWFPSSTPSSTRPRR